jgi:hypothetical protein
MSDRIEHRAPRPSRTGMYIAAAVIVVVSAVGVPMMRKARTEWRQEIIAMQGQSATVATTLTTLSDSATRIKATLAFELLRAESREEKALHLVVAIDSGTVALMRDGIALRTMPARFSGAAPTRGTQAIARIAFSQIPGAPPTVDSLGQVVRVATPETKVERVTLSDGTIIEGGDASEAFLGGIEAGTGPRRIVVSRRDFAAVRPNLVRGMKAFLF